MKKAPLECWDAREFYFAFVSEQTPHLYDLVGGQSIKLPELDGVRKVRFSSSEAEQQLLLVPIAFLNDRYRITNCTLFLCLLRTTPRPPLLS